MNELLKLSNINLENKGIHRLKNINLTINTGEKIAILGKSGSGKSSLIKVANGTIRPTTGKVLYNGIDIKKISRKQRCQIATLWQDLRLIDELSVIQNINTGILGRKNLLWSFANLIRPIEVNECINCLNVAQLPNEIINTNINELSSGQRTRVAIAKLVRQKSMLFLADEPLSSLDPDQGKNILETLLKESECNSFTIPSTCIISLHQPQLANSFTRVIGIKEGNVFFDLDPIKINSQIIRSLYR